MNHHHSHETDPTVCIHPKLVKQIVGNVQWYACLSCPMTFSPDLKPTWDAAKVLERMKHQSHRVGFTAQGCIEMIDGICCRCMYLEGLADGRTAHIYQFGEVWRTKAMSPDSSVELRGPFDSFDAALDTFLAEYLVAA